MKRLIPALLLSIAAISGGSLAYAFNTVHGPGTTLEYDIGQHGFVLLSQPGHPRACTSIVFVALPHACLEEGSLIRGGRGRIHFGGNLFGSPVCEVTHYLPR